MENPYQCLVGYVIYATVYTHNHSSKYTVVHCILYIFKLKDFGLTILKRQLAFHHTQ